MKKHVYKYLTKDMQNVLDEKIKEIGKEALFDAVEENIAIEEISRLQNQPEAFKEIYRGHWHMTKWLFDFIYTPTVVNLDSLEQEMLYYIDKKRYLNFI